MNADKTVVAHFNYSLNITVNPVGRGATSPYAGEYRYTVGTSVPITVKAVIGAVFDHWSGDCTGNGACNVTMNANRSVTAHFTPIEYTLSTSVVGSGSVTKSPDKTTYLYGETVQLTAIPDAGWKFSKWTGNLSGTTNPTTIYIDGNKSVTATFVLGLLGGPGNNSPERGNIPASVNPAVVNQSIQPALVGPQVDNLSIQPTLGGPSLGNQSVHAIHLGQIKGDHGVDLDDNGMFDELVLDVEITSSEAGKYRIGGLLQAGENPLSEDMLIEENIFRADSNINLIKGTQTVQVSFDGLEIGDNRVNGPFTVQALWVKQSNPGGVPIALSDTLAYQTYTYQTSPYKATDFKVTPALISDNFSHSEIDGNNNGLYDAVQVDIGLDIYKSGPFQVEGDLHDGQGNYIGNASWTGTGDMASLLFDIAETQPPYTLENLKLIDQQGPLLDSRYYRAYEINDFDGLVEIQRCFLW